MHPVDIRSALKKAGYTAEKVASDLGVTGPAVRNAIDSKTRSRRVEERISEITQIALWELWPKWYQAPAGTKAPAVVGVSRIHPQTLSFVLRAIEAELESRVRTLAKPYEVQMQHVAIVYNMLGGITQDDPDFATRLQLAASTHVDAHAYDGGPGLEHYFLRRVSMPAQSGTVITSTGADAKIAGRDMVGVQINTKGKR
ncbi:MAG: helix-turn-helix domain-containing protein [Xanthomonadales bacterium]|nr:helix-turn-helix domain-containing protein [Xanthomonadales bacterium]